MWSSARPSAFAAELFYEWRLRRSQRVVALAVAALGYLFTAILCAYAPGNLAAAGCALVVVALCSSGLCIAALGLGIDTCVRLFRAPSAYMSLLPPSGGRAALGARIALLAADLAIAGGLSFGMALIVSGAMQGHAIFGTVMPAGWPFTSAFSFDAVTGLLDLFEFALVVYAAKTLRHSVFADSRHAGLLAFMSAVALLWVMPLLDVVAAPFAIPYLRTGFFSIVIAPPEGFNLANTAYVVIRLARLAGLFLPTAWLLEHRMNLQGG